jgi:hypothetical protein
MAWFVNGSVLCPAASFQSRVCGWKSQRGSAGSHGSPGDALMRCPTVAVAATARCVGRLGCVYVCVLSCLHSKSVFSCARSMSVSSCSFCELVLVRSFPERIAVLVP